MVRKVFNMFQRKHVSSPVFGLAFALLLALFMLLPTIPAVEAAPDHSVFDGILNRKWQELGQNDEIDLIVQFRDEVREEDLATLEGLGFTLYEQYRIIPGVHARGTKEMVTKLSHYHRVYWIEYNQHLKYYLDVSTTTIRATNAWNRIVKDYAGSELRDGSGAHIPMDGTGVTIVVADTGIDATHPDLDYREKVVRNLKKDVDDPLTPWVELPNTDNLFGHGTHCAGIAAGNGDASAGERKGVAPGATLIGLGIGDPWETNEVGCFEWVWENSRPNNNPYNIRVMTNSWGYESVDASFKDAVIQAANRLTYENNVIVTFAAGNDGGSGDDVRTNPYGNQPGMICVAATQRDGSGMASFSSRGERTQNASWPDIGAPGVEIWAARDTTGFIVNAVAGDTNPYYTAISGTSMATPHVAGVAAVLWQAAPSLRFSSYTEDYTGELPGEWHDGQTDIHELELILELTSDYLEPSGDNGVPGEYSLGHHKRKHDFAQGYGQVNVERAVALALTLEEMRKTDPHATVDDALQNYQNIMRTGLVQKETNAIQKTTNRFVEGNAREQVSWFGEVIELDELFYPQVNALFVPEEAEYLVVDLNYDSPEPTNPQSGLISLTVDRGNGEENLFLIPDPVDPSHATIIMDIGDDPDKGKDWLFEVHNVLGTRTEYRVNFRLVFPGDGDFVVDEAFYFRFAEEVDTSIIPGLGDTSTRMTILQNYYDLSKIDEPYVPSQEEHVLTVTVENEVVNLNVYRSADPSVIVASGVTSKSHAFSLPADDLYFVRAQQDGFWDYTSEDVFLSKDRELVIPRLKERSEDVPYIEFTTLKKNDQKVAGETKVGIDAGDEQGISSVELFIDGKRVANWNFADHPTQTYLDYAWDTTNYDDGEHTLKVQVFDAEGNFGEAERTVEVDNEDDEDNWRYIFGGLGVALLVVAVGLVLSRKSEDVPEAIPEVAESAEGTEGSEDGINHEVVDDAEKVETPGMRYEEDVPEAKLPDAGDKEVEDAEKAESAE